MMKKILVMTMCEEQSIWRLWLALLLLAPAAVFAAPVAAESAALRFDISSFVVDGASLLTPGEIKAAVAPFIGKNKDFFDVQHALEAVEDAYAERGYTAVRVSLPEQDMENGTVHFRAVESRFGQVVVKGQQHFSEEGIRWALSSVRQGAAPRSRQIARELKLANENPARQLEVVMKAAKKTDVVDADIRVTEQSLTAWGMSFDNTGSGETGRTRLGLSYRHANLMDADHVGTVQMQVSPQHMGRVRVFGGSYKVPLYQSGNSMEFFGGYSSANSAVGGLANFQGGGALFNMRYHQMFDAVAGFEPRLDYGMDWRNFRRIDPPQPSTAAPYNEIAVTPLSLDLAVQGKQEYAETNFDLGVSANVPLLGKGRKEQFASYDPSGLLVPDANYRIVRYGAACMLALDDDWQARAALAGQWTRNALVLGEQMRLGGMNAVRGFIEGSEVGESGARWTLEAYSPAAMSSGVDTRALVFFDGGSVHSNSGAKSSIRSYGLGLRASLEQISFRLDAGRISKAGIDPLQKKGDWRMHAAVSAMF